MPREAIEDKDRRPQAPAPQARWQSALTSIAPNKILVRGYALDEMMGRLSFAEAVYLLLMASCRRWLSAGC